GRVQHRSWAVTYHFGWNAAIITPSGEGSWLFLTSRHGGGGEALGTAIRGSRLPWAETRLP
ncbi:MAG: hypothetical protein P8M79_08420, partial [Alphaproteobacteria bacterium]|nr:hypothetical protein [Alphaproteobacteria bacterium]